MLIANGHKADLARFTVSVTRSDAADLRQIEAIAGRLAERLLGSPNRIASKLSAGAGKLPAFDLAVETTKGDWGLSTGLAGQGLFLAAAGRACGRDDLCQLATSILPKREWIEDSAQAEKLAAKIGVGAAQGLSSLVYALMATGKILENDELLETAIDYAGCISLSSIRADQALSVADGAAGVALVLLELHRLTGAPHLIRQAITAGNTLMLMAREVDERPAAGSTSASSGGRLSWQVPGLNPTGFFRGTAGVVAALSKLAEVTQQPRFFDIVARSQRSADWSQPNFPAKSSPRGLRTGESSDWECTINLRETVIAGEVGKGYELLQKTLGNALPDPAILRVA
jgi:lantibiotic modifying enzyme